MQVKDSDDGSDEERVKNDEKSTERFFSKLIEYQPGAKD